jgi:signal peptidase I
MTDPSPPVGRAQSLPPWPSHGDATEEPAPPPPAAPRPEPPPDDWWKAPLTPSVTPPPPPPPPSVTPAPGRRPSSGRPLRGAVEWIVIVAVALIGAFLIRTFLIEAFFIPSDSMVPTLQRHDRVLVNKLSFELHPVHRGDIVVFNHPPGFDPTIKDLIKRVIGLPGESVSAQHGHVYINGRLLNEPYLPAGTVTGDFLARIIPPHAYWVMGDNRGNSSDSRVFGAIPRHLLVGRAFILVWPLNRIQLL